MPSVLANVFVLFVLAEVGAALAMRLKQPTVAGQIIAGLLIGPVFAAMEPHPGATAAAVQTVDALLSNLGAVILLLTVGLEFRVRQLVRVARRAALISGLGLTIPTLSVLVFVHAEGYAVGPALLAGLALATSSIAVTSAVLEDLGCLATEEAQMIIDIALLDDLICVVTASILDRFALLTGWSPLGLALFLGEIVATGVLLTTVGGRMLARVRPLIAHLHLRRASLTITLAGALGLAALAAAVGLPAILGAFLAGLTIAEAGLGEEVNRELGPIYVFLVPFFFVIAGAQVTVPQLLNPKDVALVGGVLVLAIVSKLVACGAGAWGLGKREALIVAVGMVPRGSTGLIIISIGRAFGVLAPHLFDLVVLVILATMIIGSLGLKAVFRACPLPPAWQR
ncbi:MAG TPA: cation:proton antiporter [Chloroflexota bacterium]|nr:cation:proton antiporter [Chloroflexota bacterium]